MKTAGRVAGQLAAIAAFSAALAWLQPVAAWFTGWTAASFGGAALAYLTNSPAVFGKRRFWWPLSMVVLLPFLGLTWLAWVIGRRRSEPATEIVPGVWLGSWPLRLPDGVKRVVDLTAEFPRPPCSRGMDYVLCATLDKTPPAVDAMRRVVDGLIADPQPTLVHCAMGHGRSATVVAAWLVARGDAGDVDAACALLAAKRPNIGLTAEQRTSATLAAGG